MKTLRYVRLAAAACAAAVLSACAATAEPEKVNDNLVIAPGLDVGLITTCDYSKVKDLNLLQDKIYISPAFAEVFELKKVEKNITEDGLLSVRIYGVTDSPAFWLWLVKGEESCKVAFRFIWFDKDGKVVPVSYDKGARFRECLPGEPVRFSALAPSEDCRNVSIAIVSLAEYDAEKVKEEEKKEGAAMEAAKPAKIDPLKQVK